MSASVPLPTAIVCLTPQKSAQAASRTLTRGPWAMMPERMTSATASISSWPRSGRAIGIMRGLPAGDVAAPPRRVPDDERVSGHVTSHDGTRADGREGSHVRAGHDHGPGADGAPVAE